MYAGSTKETRIMYKTKPAKPNGLNPVWESNESYVFNVSNPSTAIVTFSVWDKLDDRSEIFLAGAAYPVSCLREGYRSIALFNSAHARTGEYAYASLLVKASKR
jgi:phosphatidylinositol phospholipase C gamma-1